jgi:hypothetical protein
MIILKTELLVHIHRRQKALIRHMCDAASLCLAHSLPGVAPSLPEAFLPPSLPPFPGPAPGSLLKITFSEAFSY